jgi:outer membrane protein assembly factor BamA
MLTPIGVLGGLRGVLYANLGGAAYGGQPFKVFASAPANIPVVTAVQFNPNGEVVNTQTQIIRVDGIRLQDARASYGFGLQSSLLGFPMHFDWTWRTLLDRDYEDTIFRACAPSPASPLTVECFPAGGLFRDLKFDFWIGYDF